MAKPLQQQLDFELPSDHAALSITSGYRLLDEQLPSGGWPVGGITEIFYPTHYQDALKLVLPALAQLSQSKKWLAWVAPPKNVRRMKLHQHGVNSRCILQIHPHPSTDGLWAVEKALRSPTCGAVMSWVSEADYDALLRLQLAAAEGQTCGIVFRPDWAYEKQSPASLRLKLSPSPDNEEVMVNII